MKTANDMKAHSGFYASFIASLKWILPLLAAITAFVVLLIA